jgi:hypothetical protein
MEGMLKENPADLIPLAASWLNPPEVKALTGCESKGYDRSQRAFVLKAVEEEMALVVDASEDHPMVNPCFVIRNWNRNSGVELTVNGEAMPIGTEARQGIVRDVDGSWTLIAWFNMESSDAVDFEFKSN